jgi:glycosyltransferase involved in cell wall biosynthesis
VKILHVTSSLNPSLGGVTQAIKTFVSMLDEKSVQSEVVTIDLSTEEYLKNESFPCYSMGKGIGWWKYNSNLLPWLKDNIERFDVVIINGLWLYHSYATWKTIKVLKKRFPQKKMPRLLVMPHGMLDPYFQQAKNRRLKAVRNWIYWKLVESNVINDADGLLFTCETELLLARETFSPYYPKKEYNVGYGITPPPAYKQEMTTVFNTCCPGLNGAPYYLFLSRIHPKKGIDLLIKAYIELSRSEGTTNKVLPKLVIAGPGLNISFGKKMQQLAQSSPANSAIYFPGMLDGDAKWGAFYGCEAFILPSHQENFGIAVAEALACGKPVLISNQVNIWREISNGGAGIVENDDLDGVIKMLEQWVNMQKEKKSEMSSNATKTYKEHFVVNEIAYKIMEVIEDINK